MLGIILSLLAAILWGLDYVLAEIIFKNDISVPFLMFIHFQFSALAIFIYLKLSKRFHINFIALKNNRFLIKYISFSILVGFIANCLIFSSIKYTNATYAGIIEIIYPLFIVLFSYILIKNYRLNWNVAIGGLLIFCGVFIVSVF